MIRSISRALALALPLTLLVLAPASPAAAPKKPAKAAKKPASAPAEPEVPVVLTDAELAEAKRVLVGHADCEFKSAVDVKSIEGKPGHFELVFAKQHFDMVPEVTTTGAVRLHDRKAGVVWIQIPVKSMLLNEKLGQRMVDMCQEPEQRAAMQAIELAKAAAVAASAAQTAASAASAASAP